MQNTKLFHLLKTFSQNEMKEFAEFVHSPFFNKNEKIIALIDYIQKGYPDFESEKFGKEVIFEAIFTNKDYDDSTMRLLSSDLLALTKRFLSIVNLERSSVNKKMHLLKELNMRKADRLTALLLPKLSDEIAASQLYDEDYFYNKILLERQQFVFYDRKLKGDWGKLFKKYDFIQTLNALNQFYLFHITDIHTDLICFADNYNFKFNGRLIDEIYKLFPEEIESVPAIRLSFLMVKMQQSKEEKYFLEAEKLVLTPALFKTVPEFIKLDLITVLINYCVERIIIGETRFRKNQFEIHKLQVKQKLFFHAKDAVRMEIFLFITIVSNAVNIGQFTWAEEFIHDNSKYLEEDVRSSVVHCCIADIRVAEKKYSDALQHLNKANLFTSFLKIIHKNLLIKIYYEKKESEALYSLLDSYRHFLADNEELSIQKKESSRAFIKQIAKLDQVRSAFNLKKVKELKNKIKIDQYISTRSREWLLEKAEELLA